MTGSAHLRGIVIAGVLAAVALALGFMTLAMNQTASNAAAPAIVPLKLRHHATTTTAAKPQVVKKSHVVRIDPNLTAALKAGLPRSVALGLAAHKVAVVQLTSQGDQVAQLALGEARAGASLAGVAFVPVDVDRNGGAVEVLTRLLGKLPVAPATFVYIRPGTLYVTLTGFNDRTIIQQAAANAAAPSTTTAATPPAPTTGAAAG